MQYHGGLMGAILPFLVLIIGVMAIALSGAPDEKGFWPILILALGVGLMLCKDRTAYSNAVIDGMSDRIVMIMITAWILASIVGVLMTITGFVEALTWLVSSFELGPSGYVLSAFIICCIVSLSTGSSFATILICAPILYPVGGLLGAHTPTLAGTILAGATFGDFIAPISDTTISSALSQKADIGATVKSRIKYIWPATLLAIIAFWISSVINSGSSVQQTIDHSGSPNGLPMLLVPVLIIWLFLLKKHLLHGLMAGLLFGTVISILFGLLPYDQLISLDLENFVARSFVIDGINRAVGISFFTILLMGLVGTVKASGLMNQILEFAEKRSKTIQQGETWISGVVSVAVLLTTHSIVAILMVADFTRSSGGRLGINPVRRANLLSLFVCVFPFVLPYFIPVILMAGMTTSGEEFQIPSVAPLYVGLYNFLSWALLLTAIVAVLFGYGRKEDNKL